MTSEHPAEGSAGKTVIVAVTGGIAAYKTCMLVSRLAQVGHQVTVLMTEAATKFVTPLTFEALSGRPVYTSMWKQVEAHDSQHISLARSADLMVIAPASTNTIAKLAHGICDNIVTTVTCAMPRETPVLIAPSMNAEMWANPITQANIAKLRDMLGYEQIGPDEGWQACRTQGAGRMAEPEAIMARASAILNGV